ncbi:hypothetical protein L798_13274 [Zootermopsis nevadensis]|uniref:Uncharacterized protein n=1 Tax=Zootermopsis nevadensis TaxID=136037 RepID=A0A067R4B7_ZOONE|nr:hypothetical protein L798_13274 [Zootermopsis nevadensis]
MWSAVETSLIVTRYSGLRRRRANMRQMWFQQDGATAHGESIGAGGKFPQHVISRFGDIHWSPRSPDLSYVTIFCGVTSNQRSTETNHATSRN